MRTMQFTGFVQAKPAASYQTENLLDGFQLSIWNQQNLAYLGMTYVTDFTLEIEIPDSFDPRGEYVKVLMKKEQALRDEFEEKIAQVRDEIRRFEAIGYSV